MTDIPDAARGGGSFLTSGEIEKQAFFSPDKQYRYALRRTFRGDPQLHRLCVWMNPSKADDVDDDASIRVGLSFARRWRDGGIIVINVFSLIETHSERLPQIMGRRFGAEHFDVIERVLRGELGHVKSEVFCGWGDKGAGPDADRLTELIRSYGLTPAAIALTKANNPCHPLRKSLELRLRPFVPGKGFVE